MLTVPVGNLYINTSTQVGWTLRKFNSKPPGFTSQQSSLFNTGWRSENCLRLFFWISQGMKTFWWSVSSGFLITFLISAILIYAIFCLVLWLSPYYCKSVQDLQSNKEAWDQQALIFPFPEIDEILSLRLTKICRSWYPDSTLCLLLIIIVFYCL